MIIKAYAKVNLTLDIVGILPNGFHGLRSVMAPVSLCDEITILPSNKLSLNSNLKALCTEDNLCLRAAKAFFAKTGISQSVSIYLNKNIPFPAGLGGGSADGGAVLNGLNSLFGTPLNNNQLLALGAELGSDVPLCMLGRPALCEGRGDILTPLANIPRLSLVIAIGQGRLSTPTVYKAYDNANLPVSGYTDNFLSALRENNMQKLISSCGNAFEQVVDDLCPETKQLRSQMQALGAVNSRLSGSGPSVFGIFTSDNQALTAAAKLQSMGYSAYNCNIL